MYFFKRLSAFVHTAMGCAARAAEANASARNDTQRVYVDEKTGKAAKPKEASTTKQIMKLRMIDEDQMEARLDAAIRECLCVCFPPDREVFARTRAWHGVKPNWSVLLEEEGGTLLAHLGVVERAIRVGECQVRVAGIQNVFTMPHYRGRGLSRQLTKAAMEEARRRGLEFGLLFCTPAIGRIYESQGWFYLAPRTILRIDAQGAEIPLPEKNITMFYPLRRIDFPAGTIHLQGNDW